MNNYRYEGEMSILSPFEIVVVNISLGQMLLHLPHTLCWCRKTKELDAEGSQVNIATLFNRLATMQLNHCENMGNGFKESSPVFCCFSGRQLNAVLRLDLCRKV